MGERQGISFSNLTDMVDGNEVGKLAETSEEIFIENVSGDHVEEKDWDDKLGDVGREIPFGMGGTYRNSF